MRILSVALLFLAFHNIHGQDLGSGNERGDVQDLLAKVESLIERIESHEGLIDEVLDVLDTVNRNVIEIKTKVEDTEGAEGEEEEEIITDPLKIGNSELRLAGGTSRTGRLEVYHAGEWGTVCDDDFTDEYAAVICKSLGLPFGNAREIHNYGLGMGKPIHLDQVNCEGAEHARHCTHAGWGVNNCEHYEDLGIHSHIYEESPDEGLADMNGQAPNEYLIPVDSTPDGQSGKLSSSPVAQQREESKDGDAAESRVYVQLHGRRPRENPQFKRQY
ncbi:hypothetical protein CAPTEDRAFT_226306 [Capitella teleta]|uniref:SRCR domain-containing protein n=1 Tax=Capitella teleta TaxID=283909 RepID=R7U8E4_CAPTE|nr:hypothetical protein CAPTEDRAFT_226306 [Capitella teleta]|eukprot:ELU02406.1 hypothetical protein CAPTEDRAFT_226306 [Capitella teleta]